MSRHRFLMLGASIVGVGMLPFAQRNYAYARSRIVTPFDYARSGELQGDDHTALLRRMFSDERLKPPYHFHLPPCPNGVGWMVVMGQGFVPFPVKSRWTLTGEQFVPTAARPPLDAESLRRSTLPNDAVLDPAAALYRKGEVVPNTGMFANTDVERGNDNITFSNVYVKGQKYDWAALNGGYFDIDTITTFLRIYQDPAAASNQWNNNVKFVGCVVNEWPGVSCAFYQLDDFDVSNNLVTWSHRGSLIFRFGARNGSVSNNRVLDGGDDCIALNGNTDNYFEQYPNNPPPKAQSVYVYGNVLSEKQTEGVRGDGKPFSGGNDIPEPPGINPNTGVKYRKRTGNSPLAVRGGENIHIGESRLGQVLGNEILYTVDGYTDVDGVDQPAQPAVEVRDMQRQTARNIWVKRLIVRQTKAGALVVPSANVTGGVYDSVCEIYTGFTDTEPSDPWKLAPPDSIFERDGLNPLDEYDEYVPLTLAPENQSGF